MFRRSHHDQPPAMRTVGETLKGAGSSSPPHLPTMCRPSGTTAFPKYSPTPLDGELHDEIRDHAVARRRLEHVGVTRQRGTREQRSQHGERARHDDGYLSRRSLWRGLARRRSPPPPVFT